MLSTTASRQQTQTRTLSTSIQKKALRALGNKNNVKINNHRKAEVNNHREAPAIQLNADLVLNAPKKEVAAMKEEVAKDEPIVAASPAPLQDFDDTKLQSAPPQIAGQLHEFAPKILVIGVGGAGGNAINNMIAKELKGMSSAVSMKVFHFLTILLLSL